ncbi:MAG TPA: MMPL family transporter [Gaiellaceae bacterium]|nr:MMPL family transporter [Gaiellaceae bacterium]
MGSQNLAARAGRWSAAHWKTATFAWIAFVVVSVAIGRAVGTVSLSDAEQSTGEAARAQAILQGAGFSQPAAENVLVQSRSLTVGDPAFRATIHRVSAQLATLSQVQNVILPSGGAVSKDRHAALVQFSIVGKAEQADKKVQPVLDAVAAVQKQSPGFTVAEFGFASANHELNNTIGKDFQKAERLSVPITFLILLFAFGAFVAAGVPVLLAFTAVLGSIGLSELVSHVAHASDATSSVILLIGMAVGVDYSLFYLKREREERLAGRGEDALSRAAATSGQAVLISGGTVLIAMAGMLLSGTKIFTSIGVGAMLVVFTAMVGSLTVLPALLGKLGDRVERGIVAVGAAGLLHVLRPAGRQPSRLLRLRERQTWLRRAKGDRPESRVWALALRPVLRRPGVSAAVAAALLIVLALPARTIHTKLLSFTDLPRSIPIVQTYIEIQKEFPGAQSPAQVVVQAPDVNAPAVQTAIRSLEREALATGQMFEPVEQFVNPSHTVARIQVPLAGNGDDAASVHALETLRRDVLPSTIGRVGGAMYAVTGETAGTHDFNQTMKARFPLVFVFVLGLAFVLLLLTFRSIVVPITAIVLNLLSVAASYGVLVWIFQDGHLQGLLGFHSNGAVVTWLPLFLFTVLFGLSMDYHVFIVSRIKELVDRGESNADAVAHGIRRTASTVTSAAAVMVAVFAIFASLRTLDIKQLGVGLAVAVLLDATVIRGVLLPATMKLLGDWNWYLPRSLSWLPRLTPEAGEPAPALE